MFDLVWFGNDWNELVETIMHDAMRHAGEVCMRCGQPVQPVEGGDAEGQQARGEGESESETAKENRDPRTQDVPTERTGALFCGKVRSVFEVQEQCPEMKSTNSGTRGNEDAPDRQTVMVLLKFKSWSLEYRYP